ncbi:MAG: IS110 family transposase [Candidatus Dormibacteraceae bacterium]
MVIETRHGLLVVALLDAGFVILTVKPDLIARRRGPARKKDDAEDARIACLLGLDRFASLKPLIPHGDVAEELRSLARDDERASRDQRRLLNRLRDAVQQWAFCSLKDSGWAREFYDGKRAAGKNHNAALRCLGPIAPSFAAGTIVTSGREAFWALLEQVVDADHAQKP